SGDVFLRGVNGVTAQDIQTNSGGQGTGGNVFITAGRTGSITVADVITSTTDSGAVSGSVSMFGNAVTANLLNTSSQFGATSGAVNVLGVTSIDVLDDGSSTKGRITTQSTQ